VATPVVVAVDAADRDAYLREVSGPVLFLVATDGTTHSLELASDAARTVGSLAWLVATTDPEVEAAAEQAAVDAGVSVALGLSGGFSANQAAAFGDFHPTGANPAGNASPADPGYVTGRFHLVAVVRPD
jgi:acyl-CoA reductase-like NAD-dependent aldehyde dehydrogenase